MTKKAFTLIELLIVVAIIAMLAALLLPALIKAKDMAKSARCIGNTKQIGLASALYVNDHATYPQLATYQNSIYPDGKKWYDDLSRYAPSQWNRDVLLCPSYAWWSYDGKSETPTESWISFGSYGYSTGSANNLGIYNYGLAGTFGNGRVIYNEDPLKEERITAPSDFIAYGDTVNFVPMGHGFLLHGVEMLSRRMHQQGALQRLYQDQTITNNLSTNRRHGGQLSYAFADGHSEKIKAIISLGSKEPRHLKRWHVDNLAHEELFVTDGSLK